MTREEAKDIILNTAFFGRKPDDIYTAIEMAADALENDKAVINKVLEIIDREEKQADTVGMAEQYQRGYKDACRFVRAAVQALTEEKADVYKPVRQI